MLLEKQVPSLENREYLIQNIEVIDIETSTACNRKCSYCPNSTNENASIENNSFMNEETFSKIINDLANDGYTGEICLQRYNEPLMDHRLPKLVSIASKTIPNATIVIYSNGDYLTIDKYKELINAGVNKFTITQHGPNASKGVKDVISYREKNPDNTIFKYKKMDGSGKFYNRGGEIQLSENQPKNFFCKALNCITINSKAEVILCCNDYHSKYTFGNAGKENIFDIYLGKNFQNQRIEAITGKFSKEICNICMYG